MDDFRFIVSNDNNSFDVGIIGSSPLQLIQAIEFAETGQRVALIERSDRLGGAWQTARVDGQPDVEIACHVIED